mgnify:CR=1 FL=1
MKKIIQFLFGNRGENSSKNRCPYCRKSIKNLYHPNNLKEKEELLMWADISPVHICKKCEGMRHFRCVTENRRKKV